MTTKTSSTAHATYPTFGNRYGFRHVLVPGITDDDALLQELRHFLDTLDNIERVDVLPYHTLGIFKYEKLGIPYPLDGVNSPTQERVENAKKILTGK